MQIKFKKEIEIKNEESNDKDLIKTEIIENFKI